MKNEAYIKEEPERMARHKDGNALIIVVCFCFIIGITSATMHKMSTGLAFRVSNYRKSAQALAIAEAGVSDALALLSEDFDAYKVHCMTSDFNEGSYIVNITTNGDTGAIISSRGTYASVTRQTTLETLGTWVTEWDSSTFGNYGIFCDGFVDANGQGLLKADLFGGDSIVIAPGATIEGSIDCVGTIDNKGTVGGTTNEGVTDIPFPEFDFQKYVTMAGGDYIDHDITVDGKNNGIDFVSGKNIDSEFDGLLDGDVYHSSFVICVDGDVVILNGAEIQGSIIATGNINMQGGHVSQTAADSGLFTEPMPSLMSLGGYVKVCSGQILNGFVYATGDVVLNGGDQVTGGVICGGQFEGRNDWLVIPGPGVVPPAIMPAGGGSVTGVRIGAWLE